MAEFIKQLYEDIPMGEHEAAAYTEFDRTIETPRGYELAEELNYLDSKLRTRKLADWAIEAIRKRQFEIMNELHQSSDWVTKILEARAADIAQERIRTGRAGEFIRAYRNRAGMSCGRPRNKRAR